MIDILRIPLIVDEHMHARDEGLSHKYTFDRLSEDCIRGGVGWVGDMPNNLPSTITAEDIARRQSLARKTEPARVFSYALIVPGSKPFPNHPLYKAFTVKSYECEEFISYQQFRETFKNYEGCEIIVHCEDLKIIAENKDKPTYEQQIEKRFGMEYLEDR